MAYYHNRVTEKSWQELQRLRRLVDFVLIGGWAVYLYTQALKSKDIDIVVSYDQLPALARAYTLSKNDRLRKYEAARGEVQIDVYLPHYSKLGLPVEDLLPRARRLEGFRVLDPISLAALKVILLTQRGRTPKGRKDFIDLLALFAQHLVTKTALLALLKRYGLGASWQTFEEFLGEQSDLPELHLNRHQYARLARRIQETE